MKSVVHERHKKTNVTKEKGALKTGIKNRIIAGILIAFFLASICVAAQSLGSSSIQISTHFSAVSEGKNPDGSPFNINEIFSSEVLEMASLKLDGKVDAETLKKHLNISDGTSVVDLAKVKQNIVDGYADYSFYPNVYTLTYAIVSDEIKKDGFFTAMEAVFDQIAMPSQKKILHSVAESYREYYSQKYIAGNIAMQADWENTNTLDYYNKATQTKAIAGKISRFIRSKYNKDPRFVSDSGVGYGDLCTEIEQMISIDIENYMSFVIQNGLTMDRDALLRQFAFMENMYNETNTRHTSAYEITKEAIEYYDANTTRVVFIPALDEQRTFYMNRTKVGIDYLVEKASYEKGTADDAMYNAERYRYLTESFSTAEPVAPEVYAVADQMYTDIKEKINTFITHAGNVINEDSQSAKHEKINTGKPYRNFDLVSMAIYGGKLFILFLMIAFLVTSFIEGTGKMISKRKWEDKE